MSPVWVCVCTGCIGLHLPWEGYLSWPHLSGRTYQSGYYMARHALPGIWAMSCGPQIARELVQPFLVGRSHALSCSTAEIGTCEANTLGVALQGPAYH